MQRDFDVHHRVAGEHALTQRFDNALFHRGDVLAWHHTALDGVDEFKALASFLRFDLQHDVAVLTLTAGLTHELAFSFVHRLADGFAVGHLRLADVGFHAEFALHAVDDDFQVQLAHTTNDGLAGFFVGVDAEGRIFSSQARQGDAHLFLVSLGLRLHSLTNHRLREHHAFERDDGAGIAQGFTGGHVLQTDAGSDVAGADFVHFLAVVRVHLHDTADTFLLAAHRVVHGVALAQHAGVDAHKGQLTDKRVGHQLERQRGELLAVVGLARGFLFVFVKARHRRHVQRRRHEFDHGVQHALHTLVLERSTTQHRLDFASNGAQTQTGGDFFLGQVAFFQVLVHQLFGGFGRGLNHLFAPFLGQFDQLGRNFLERELHALGRFVPDDGLHLAQINHALEVFFGTDRDHDGHGVGLQAQLHLVHDLEEVGAGAVHLVHEGQTRHAVFVGLTPDRFRLRLHAAHGAVHHAGAVQHAHGALDFNREVDVAGGVDDVDAVLREGVVHSLPETGGGSGRDRDATLLLLLHPVHGGSAVVHFTNLVVHAGIKQNALGRCGLAGVDVRRNTNVAVALDGSLASHDGSLVIKK